MAAIKQRRLEIRVAMFTRYEYGDAGLRELTGQAGVKPANLPRAGE